MRKISLVFATCLILSACGAPGSLSGRNGGGSQPEASAQRYRGTGTVLEEKGAEPVLCLGVVMGSVPPQCGGPRIAGWDWDDVSGEESAAGTTWGDFEVTGLYDGDTLTLIEAAPPRRQDVDDDPITSACPKPPRGWERPDPDLTSEVEQLRAITAARREPDFAGAWIDYIDEPTEFTDPTDTVLNLAFTGDLDRHERDIRRDWGGPLCVAEHERTLERLHEIQAELSGRVGQELGLEVLSSSSSENRNVVELSVVVLDAATQQEIDDRYGDGTVEITAQLEPVP